jgi:hypothetical protein
VQGPLSDAAVIGLLKEKFVCVQEVIPGAETTPESLPAERRQQLERFAHGGRFFFGRIRILSSDGKDVLGELRSLPGSDAETRKSDGDRFLALARSILDGRGGEAVAGPGDAARRFEPPMKGGPARLRFREGGPASKQGGPPRLGPRSAGPKIGDLAPNFELKYLDSEQTFKLSENFGKRATVLIFHSFT